METRLQLTEENFESQQSGKSDLLIHIGEENISYAIVDKGREQLKALADYKANLSDLDTILASDRYLKYFYRKIKISTNTFKFTFIPRDLYRDSDINDYSQFISPKSPADVLVNDIRPFRIRNVTSVDTEIQNVISARFNKPVLYSQANPFIEGAFNISTVANLYSLCINFQQERLEIAVIKEGALLFYNFFESKTPDEFNYFLLLVVRQFNLNTENTKVRIAGEAEKNDDNYSRVEKYFSSIESADPVAFVQCSDTFNQVNLSRYFSLLSLNLCE